MSASNAKTSPAMNLSEREILLTRVFDAPRELVWDAWTDPEKIVHWWGPRGFTTTIYEMDLRPGGIWRHTIHGPDGTDHPFESRFIEVVKPERIVYSHDWANKSAPGAPSVLTWTFEALGEKTRLTLRMVFPSAAVREHVFKTHGVVEGGEQTLERLADQLAKSRQKKNSNAL